MAGRALQDAYDIYDPVVGQDGYIETDDLNDIMRENGFRSLNSFTASEGEGWRESLTRAVAARWCRERYSVPPDPYRWPSALSRLASCAAAFDPYSDRALVAAAIERRWCARKMPSTWPHTLAPASSRARSFAPLRSLQRNRLSMGWEWRRGPYVADKTPRAKGHGPNSGH